MSYEQNLRTIDAPASADLSTKQYYLVNLNDAGQVRVAGDGAVAIGTLQNKPDAANRVAQVGVGDVIKVLAGGTFDAGDLIAGDGNGKAIEATTTGDFIHGVAMEDAVDGKIISMLWTPMGKVPA